MAVHLNWEHCHQRSVSKKDGEDAPLLGWGMYCTLTQCDGGVRFGPLCIFL